MAVTRRCDSSGCSRGHRLRVSWPQPLNSLIERLHDQDAEDAFCQQLLLLSAKWWDSEARYSIVSQLEGESAPNQRVDSAFDPAEKPPPIMREKRLIKAGWLSTGGVWITEFDTTWTGVDKEGVEIGRLRMTRTMGERCALLRSRLRQRTTGI